MEDGFTYGIARAPIWDQGSGMPRYFFHTEDGRRLSDMEGSELADERTARNEAVCVLGQMMREDPEGFWAHGIFRLTVADAAGATLFTLDLKAIAADRADQPQSK